MARITRALQKIFGINASSTGVGIFGSEHSGTPAYSKDPETIQSLSEFETGWEAPSGGGAVPPKLEDRNALDLLYSSQLAYILQEGIAEYNASTTYYTRSLVKDTVSSKIYESIADDNIGNALTDIANWKLWSCPGNYEFDLIIDSDAKLAAWANVAATGTFTKVLIKAGTWDFDCSTNTKVSGDGINLTDAGTKEIVAEPGAVLNFTNLAHNKSCLKYNTVPTTLDYRIFGLNVTYSCAASSTGFGISNCANLHNVSIEGEATQDAYGFYNCSNLLLCSADITGGSGWGAFGFASCGSASYCGAVATGASGYGFSASVNLNYCSGTGVGNAGGGSGIGFYSCTIVTNCTGVGTGTGGASGYGFSGSRRLLFNNGGTCTTAKYVTSYVEATGGSAIASGGTDTATGGWNV